MPQDEARFCRLFQIARLSRGDQRSVGPIAGLLKSILKLQASAGDDNTRTCDLGPVCGNRALRIGSASLGPRLEREGPRHDGKEQRPSVARHAEDSNGRPISQVSNAAVA